MTLPDPGQGTGHLPEDLTGHLNRIGARDAATTDPGPLVDALGALTGRVRRRRRAKALGAGAVTLSVAAALAVAVPGIVQPGPPATPPTTSVAPGVAGLCGTPSALLGQQALPATDVTVTAVADAPEIAADQGWSVSVQHAVRDGVSVDGPQEPLRWGPSEAVVVADDGPHAGLVVGVGASSLGDGDELDPGDGVTSSSFEATTTLLSCDGGLLAPGHYEVVVADLVDGHDDFGDSGDGGDGGDTGASPTSGSTAPVAGSVAARVERASTPVSLTVRAAGTAPDGRVRPAWLDGTDLWCGMDEGTELLPTLSAVPFPDLRHIFVLGDGDGVGMALTNTGSTDLTFTVGARPGLVWIDASTGTVASFGADDLGTTRTLSVPAGKTVDYLGANLEHAPDSCGSGALPPGVYLVRAFTRVLAPASDGPAAFLSSGDVWVAVLPDGSVTTDSAQVSAARTATVPGVRSGYQPAWLTGSPLACGATWEDLRTGDAPARFTDERYGSDPLTLSATLTRDAGIRGALTLPGHAGLLWMTKLDGQPSRIVSFGPDPGRPRSWAQDDDLRLDAAMLPVMSCDPSSTGTNLPAGRYQVAVYTWVAGPDGARHWVVGSGATGVVVGNDGSVAGD